MSDSQAELLTSFRTFIQSAEEGASIPPVDEHDLKALHELCIERAKRYCGKDGVISIEQTARVCTPGANLPAVWLRHTQLRSLYRHGQLTEWQQPQRRGIPSSRQNSNARYATKPSRLPKPPPLGEVTRTAKPDA